MSKLKEKYQKRQQQQQQEQERQSQPASVNAQPQPPPAPPVGPSRPAPAPPPQPFSHDIHPPGRQPPTDEVLESASRQLAATPSAAEQDGDFLEVSIGLVKEPPRSLEELKRVLAHYLCVDGLFAPPIESSSLMRQIRQQYRKDVAAQRVIKHDDIVRLLLEWGGLRELSGVLDMDSVEGSVVLKRVDRRRMSQWVAKAFVSGREGERVDGRLLGVKRREPSRSPSVSKGASSDAGSGVAMAKRPRFQGNGLASIPGAAPDRDDSMDLDALLNAPSAKVKQIQDTGNELRELLAAPTAKQTLKAQTFQNKEGSQLLQFCFHGTREDCCRANKTHVACNKVHFRRIILPHTDVSLGDCSYLDSCRHMNTCKYVHYEIDQDLAPEQRQKLLSQTMATKWDIGAISEVKLEEWEPQWIKCDIRKFDFSIFGDLIKVIMADPPWDIHMDLPYGTMTDKEMKEMRVDQIQREGVLFLWVTGRAMELGRDCMELWGYRRVEEVLWVKCNQLQRIIRTGRTGHWLNHSKEHCLVGIKGNPSWLNTNIDCDIILSEVRETSRKPDEVYRIIERMAPQCLKLELFGRMHNTRKNWITLGNQLEGTRLSEPGLIERYNQIASSLGLEVAQRPPPPPPDAAEKPGTKRRVGRFDRREPVPVEQTA
ncbi:unnamed protein product [Vitrella brassicaformis CCMP3155]|uniref:Uncharacterized protein n=2 Tax=Vitrella brassicaformis TaxID=1169539 RepID=A0A0G4EDS2_VITBC|nr:unnamed protein product [Vitrella brassicaformis CCMP3155]|eukprot:CEL93876.1 unnamed protein product [Vitrella brassicaformis CCMP3155]